MDLVDLVHMAVQGCKLYSILLQAKSGISLLRPSNVAAATHIYLQSEILQLYFE